MTVQTIILLVLVGLAAGFLSGMVGVGGGIILVPALVYVLGYEHFKAQGTSLGLLLLPAGIFAVINYYHKGYVDFKVVALLAVGFVLGGYLGSKFTLGLPQATVKKIFAIVLMLVSLKMFFLDSAMPKNEKSGVASHELKF